MLKLLSYLHNLFCTNVGEFTTAFFLQFDILLWAHASDNLHFCYIFELWSIRLNVSELLLPGHFKQWKCKQTLHIWYFRCPLHYYTMFANFYEINLARNDKFSQHAVWCNCHLSYLSTVNMVFDAFDWLWFSFLLDVRPTDVTIHENMIGSISWINYKE